MYTLTQKSRTITPQHTETTDYFMVADFATINKNDSLWDYATQVEDGKFKVEKVKIVRQVTLSGDDWNLWTESLLSDQPWLKGMGGNGSTYQIPPNSFHEVSIADQIRWIAGQYRKDCVLVKCSEHEATVVVDPQGSGYARYVGINVRPA